VIESVHCPTCSTHYGLRAPRVRAGLRRALCFRCSSIFSIEEAVRRLTENQESTVAAVDLGIEHGDLFELHPIHETTPAPEPTAVPQTIDDATPSLTLGDLEGVEEEILEKTLVTNGDLNHPEMQVAPTSETTTAQEDDLSAEGGYRSAKDAIAKLLGNLPAPEPNLERRGANRSSTQMDVEATLDALESTLGGVNTKELTPPPAPAAPELTASELEPAKPTASTMKLTHDEIVTAMKAASFPASSSGTRPAPIAKPTPPIVPAPTPIRETPLESDINLLKVQVGQEIYNNVSLDQITTWIEQGRVQDFHMVARQFSENWIEAGKVASLRPIFERIRRQQIPAAQQAQAVIVPPPNETAPIKKSLFGGLFNRG
jgi:hypothetical protein